MKNTRRLVTLAATVAVAMVLSYLESLIPAFTAIPGIKVGFANIAIIFTLYRLGAREAVLVSVIRVALSSILFGSPVSFIYALAGATLSLTLMAILKRFTPLGTVTVSIVGGITHNLAQIGVASLLLETDVFTYYFPFLLLSGTVAGIVVGIAGYQLIKRIKLQLK